MIKKKILCIIPARGGSKSIRHKNLLKLGKFTLLEHTIKFAKLFKKIDEIVLSSDSQKILKKGKKYKIKCIKRSKKNSLDFSLVADTIHEVLRHYNKRDIYFENIILLEPTFPFRKKYHLNKCLNAVVNNGYDSSATFSKSSVHPWKLWNIKKKKTLPFNKNNSPWKPKQFLSQVYKLTGSVYVISTKKFKSNLKKLLFGKIKPIICNEEEHFIDIDQLKDYRIAKLLFKNENKRY